MSSGTQTVAGLTIETKLTTGDVPPPLVGASTIVVENKAYVFGGRLVSSRQMTNHLYILNLNTLVWTRHNGAQGDSSQPRPRYFHSCSFFGDYLVIFGGMSYSVRRTSQSLCALDDICLFNLQTLTWKFPDIQPSKYAPQARYAHLAVCSAGKLVVMGGQDMSNKYINDVAVFDPTACAWIQRIPLSTEYGAYRAVAFCPSTVDTSTMSSPPFWERGNSKEDLPLCIYSNYNFANVTRDLQCFSSSSATPEFINHSTEMTGATLPPGLRFPSGNVLGHHLILTGTYLTPSHRSFHVWALNLANLTWTKIDTGMNLAQGSWNRGVMYENKNQYVIFGDRTRDLLEDYNHRQVNFVHIAVVELEAFGIYTYPKETCAPVAQELGLSMLNEPSMADIEFITEDGRSIPANSSVIAFRWNQFSSLLQKNSDKSGFKKLRFSEGYNVTLAFLQYLYTDHLMTAQQHQPNILSRLLILSDIYNLPRLRILAVHGLHQILSLTTASVVYEAAALTGSIALQIRALRVMTNAKKIIQQQQQKQKQQNGASAESPSAFPTHYSNRSYSHEDEETSHYKTSPIPPATRRLIASKSSTTSESNFAPPIIPSPKISKSTHLTKTPPLLFERQRKNSLISQQKQTSPFEKINMGVPF